MGNDYFLLRTYFFVIRCAQLWYRYFKRQTLTARLKSESSIGYNDSSWVVSVDFVEYRNYTPNVTKNYLIDGNPFHPAIGTLKFRLPLSWHPRHISWRSWRCACSRRHDNLHPRTHSRFVIKLRKLCKKVLRIPNWRSVWKIQNIYVSMRRYSLCTTDCRLVVETWQLILHHRFAKFTYRIDKALFRRAVVAKLLG